jgi:hypothetical protein
VQIFGASTKTDVRRSLRILSPEQLRRFDEFFFCPKFSFFIFSIFSIFSIWSRKKNSVNNNGKNEQFLVKTFFVSLFLRRARVVNDPSFTNKKSRKMNLEKKSLVKVVHFFRYSSEKINFETVYRHMWKMHIYCNFKFANFWIKKTRQIEAQT